MREFKVPTKVYGVNDLLWFAQESIMKWYEFDEPAKGFAAVRATGKFEGNFDYNVGLVVMKIRTVEYGMAGGESNFMTRVSISNIDDGLWDANSNYFETKEESEALTEKVYRAYVEFENRMYGSVMPTEKELNDFLMPFALWGEFTG